LAGRTPHEAVENFLDPLRRCLARVTNSQLTLTPDGHRATEDNQAATLARGELTTLKGDPPLGLLIGFQYRVVQTEDPERGPWKVSIVRYAHSLSTKEGKEILAFHWHPGSGPDWPHVHVGTIALKKRGTLTRKSHVPTGRVAVEQVLRLAIEDLGVGAADDWPQVFEESQSQFEEYRTWP
jgi:hypothetical protein